MSVGGNIIEMTPVTLEGGAAAIRLRVMDGLDESFVNAEPWPEGMGPSLGESVWWQSGKIYFNRDRCWVRKIGNSSDAHRRSAA